MRRLSIGAVGVKHRLALGCAHENKEVPGRLKSSHCWRRQIDGGAVKDGGKFTFASSSSRPLVAEAIAMRWGRTMSVLVVVDELREDEN